MRFLRGLSEDFGRLARWQRVGLLLLVTFFLAFPWIKPSAFALSVMIQFLLFALFGMGWNTIGGYGGQIDLGKAMYAGIGAYTTAVLVAHWGIPPWVGLPLGIALAILWSFIVGFPLFLMRGHYFAIATIAASLILQDIARNWRFIGGAAGLSLPFNREPAWLYLQFRDEAYYYYLILVFCILGMLYLNAFRKSRLGYQMRAIKESEEEAGAMGIDIRWSKVKVYAIASAFAATGGFFIAVHDGYIDPDSVMSLSLSVKIALMAMLGGAATLWGPVLGAAILVPLDRYLGVLIGGVRELQGLDFMLYGLLIMAIAVAEPRGVLGLIARIRRTWALRRRQVEIAAEAPSRASAHSEADPNEEGGERGEPSSRS